MRNTKYTTEEYNNSISKRNIKTLDEYKNAHTNIEHECNVCAHIWSAKPGAIRRGHGCPNCYRRRVSKPLSLVKQQLELKGWMIIDDTKYTDSVDSPSVELMQFKHIQCGDVVTSNIERILSSRKICLICNPRNIKSNWSKPVCVNNRTYYSLLEAECCEYLITLFGDNDVILHKPYNQTSKKTCDAYINSINTYVEIIYINKPCYHDIIYKKRRLVDRFIFVTSLNELKLFFR